MEHPMKICTIICSFLIAMLFMLGMRTSDTQTCCNLNCPTYWCLTMYLQPVDAMPPTDGDNSLTFDRIRPGKEMRDRLRPEIEMRGGRKPKGERPITPKMVEHIMDVAKDIDPELAAQLTAMCEKDPDALHSIIRRQGHRLGSLIRLRESDPELYEVKVSELKIDAEIYYVAESIRGQDPTDPETIAQVMQLEGLVRAKTEMTIQAQTLYIERLERHLSALQNRLTDTKAQLDEIVAKRLGQLLSVVVEDQDKPPTKVD